MTNPIIYSVIYFVVFFVFIYIYSKREKGVSTFFVFGLFATIYYASIPMEMFYLNHFKFFNEPHILTENYVPPEILSKIIIMSTLSLLGFGIGYYLVGFRTKISDMYKTGTDNKALLYLLWFFLLTMLAVVGVFYHEKLINISNYSGNVEIKASSPMFNFLTYQIVILLAILEAYFILSRKINIIQALIWSSFVIAWSIYSSDKDPLLLGLLPLFLYLNRVKQFQQIKYQMISYSLVLISIPILVIAFSEYRGFGKVTFQNVNAEKGMYKLTDARGGMRVLTTIMQDEDLEYSYGKTYLHSLVLWIPRAIWPNRPLDAPQSFARSHMKEWKPGHGLGYSPLAEAYQNFGVIGAFIQFLFFGIIWGTFWNSFRKLFANYNMYLFNSIYAVFGIYMLIMMHRGASNTLVTTFIQTLLPFALIVFSLRLIQKINTKTVESRTT